VNNADLQHTASVGEFPTLQWDAILAVNLSAAFHAIKAVLPQMVERGCGRIVNIASVHGLVGAPNKAACVAARHGLVGLTRTVALETAQSGVTCNAICPGPVRASLPEAAAEIGALTTFLCGDAAGSITGAALAVDGGWTAQ
jgi:3-hydroxybutyrate dehydrogenase